MIFLTLVIAFGCLAGSFFEANNGNIALSGRLQVVAGAFAFCTTLFGWWIFIAIMLASLDFPFSVPGKFSAEGALGFLLTVEQLVIYPASSRARARDARLSRCCQHLDVGFRFNVTSTSVIMRSTLWKTTGATRGELPG
jgi:hypothetical protein